MTTENNPARKPRNSRWIQWYRDFHAWFKRTVKIQEDTDYEATIKNISSSVEFKGTNVWILFFAIIVASIGLNVNSTAVIIGAMLISPLMGPINGIGLAIGITDNELLKKSLNNLVIMVIISLIASFFYFLLSPLGDAQSELLARTRPTIFDVLIAFFGGSAGIVAITRKSQPFTVISGVAIATALMPPLCTAGYGLATLQFNYFFGAFYLFFINSFFIALATYLGIKYLHFPSKKYLDPTRSKLVKRSIYIFSILVTIPSIIIALQVVKESSFNAASKKFITEIQDTKYFEKAQLINSKKEFGNKKQEITLSVVGQLSNKDIQEMQNIMRKNYGLYRADLIIKQTDNNYISGENAELIEAIIDKKDEQLAKSKEKILLLENELQKIDKNQQDNAQIAKELSIQYPYITSFSVTNLVYTQTKTLKNDTIPTIFVNFSENISAEQKQQLINWLRIRLDCPDLQLK